jgi:hypothetical protein
MLTNIRKTVTPIAVKLPNGRVITSTHSGLLNITTLPIAARTAHIFPQLTGSLLSIGQFCDSGYSAVFNSATVTINDAGGMAVLTGYRDENTKLYMVDLTLACTTASRDPPSANAATGAANESLYVARTQAEMVKFYHACLGSPSDSTFLTAAMKGYLETLPGLTPSAIRKYPPNSIATAKGHLDRIRQGIRSTKKTKKTPSDESLTDWHPIATKSRTGTAEVYMKIIPRGELHHDNTGQFPVRSSSGSNYVAVSYCGEGNYIHVEPLQSTSAADSIQCHHNTIAFYRGCHIEPSFLRLDNQTSTDLEMYLKNVAKVNFQYIAPHNHRVNKAERAIRTWKNHFIAILATADPAFPITLWDKLLFQSELTLNLLRTSGSTPHISAYHQLHGKYDYSSHPIGPLGCKVLVFEPPNVRSTYGPHGEEGFYIGPAMKHYRCFEVWVTKTKHSRITDTLSWHLPSKYLIPSQTPHDVLIEAINSLTKSLEAYAKMLPVLVNKAQLPIKNRDIQSAIKLLNGIFSFPESIQRVTGHSEPDVEELIPATNTTTNDQQINDRAELGPESVQASQSDPSREDDTFDATNDQQINDRAELGPESVQASQTDPIREDDTFDAEKVIGHRGKLNSTSKPLQFRVRWLGYSSNKDTWEPINNIQNCKAFIEYIDARPSLWYLYAPKEPQHSKTNINNSNEIPQSNSKTANISAAMQAHNIHSSAELKQTPLLDSFEYACAAGSIDTDGNTLRYRKCIHGTDTEHWLQAAHEELVRLVSVRNTMHFIKKSEIPKNRLVSYYNPRCNRKWKNGVNIFRVRGTYGGNISDYSGETAAFTADMATVKILLNKTVSDNTKRWMTADITDMYLHTANMERPEYMFIDLANIPQRTFDHFNLDQFIKEGDKSNQ